MLNKTSYHEERATRIWLVNLFFGPGMAPTGQFLESLAVELDEVGHDVEVLTGRAAYHSDSQCGEPRFRGKVHALFSGPKQAKRFRSKLLSWVCFYISVGWYLATHRLPDKVLVMSTPPFLHLIVSLRNLFARRPAEIILWNQDTYPNVLAAVGMFRRGSISYRVLDQLDRWSMRRVGKAIALDRAMEDVLRERGAANAKTIPHWDLTPEKSHHPATVNPELLQRMNRYRHVVIYTGNYGWGHDLSSLWKWWESNPNQRDFFFLFLGGGDQWDLLKKRQEEERRDDLEVLPYLPQGEFEALVQRADLGLVALDKHCVGLMSPSKIHAYLGHGKPLLYVGPERTNVADAIEQYQCGFRCPQGDVEALTCCLKFLASDGFDLTPYRRRAFDAAQMRYCESVVVEEVRRYIMEVGHEPPMTIPFPERLPMLERENQAVPMESQCA